MDPKRSGHSLYHGDDLQRTLSKIICTRHAGKLSAEFLI
jgi:hypothetical protein